ncbi:MULTISPECIES: hypothetical protein [unclassified Carboxylicivirga]|uniref:hypothetical protein n=1 Tax=Carboxylicivirga TaxID=1628153 RepID=UPI003D34A497
MPKRCEYTLPIGLTPGLILACTHAVAQISFRYGLQKWGFIKKPFDYAHEVPISTCDALKSIQKTSKAIEIYSTWLLFSILQVRYGSLFNPNPTL